MAFYLPRLSRKKPQPTARPRYKYSPRTEEELAEGVLKASTYVPRKILEQMGEDIDEALWIGDTGVSAKQLLFHPFKTSKKAFRRWTIGRAKKQLTASAEAELIWKPRLLHLENTGDLVRGAQVKVKDIKEIEEIKDAVLRWISAPTTRGKDRVFEDVLKLKDKISPEVWSGLKMKRGWDEISELHSHPARYLWRTAFGKRGVYGKEALLYRFTPQKWMGEPLGKALGKTAAGKAVAGVKKTLQKTAGKAAKGAVKAGWVATKTLVKKIATKILGSAAVASISSAIGGAIGSLGGPVGAAIGAVAAPAITKLTEWTAKVTCCSCGCLGLLSIAFISSILFTIGSALSPKLEEGLGPPEVTSPIRVAKTVQPDRIPKDGGEHEITYTFAYSYVSDGEEEATEVTLVDDYNETEVSGVTDPSGEAADDGSRLTWNLGNLPPGTVGIKMYEATIKADDDKVVVNKVTISGKVGGVPKGMSAAGIVIVGNPTGLPPSGWPVITGCITQGPHNPDGSHKGLEAIDIGPSRPEPVGARVIFATHDGTARVYYNGNGPYPALGNYVIVTSASGTFSSYYGHLYDIAPFDGEAVNPGDELGRMGNSGTSTGLHLHYELRGTFEGQDLRMGTPYIPADIPPCSSRADCNYCF